LGISTQSSDFQDAVIKCISHIALKRTYGADQVIIHEGETCEAVYFILDGEVRIFKLSQQGRQQTLVYLKSGKAFNTVPVFLNDSINPANATADTPVTLLILYKDQIDEAIRRCPDLALVFIHEFAERLYHLSNLASDLALQPVRSRLASFILEQLADNKATRWTHEEIASHIGTVREVVSRTIRDFEKKGYIRKERQRLIIVNPQLLEEEVMK
jgi:CRP-like cAMP-binding protein